MRKNKITMALLLIALLVDPMMGRSAVKRSIKQQPQNAPRKYIIKPLNLGTNTEIRARSSRNIQVRVTDENDRPVPDAPLLFLLSSGSFSGGAGSTTSAAGTAATGATGAGSAGSAAGATTAGATTAGATGSAGAAGAGAGAASGAGAGGMGAASGTGTLAGQTSLRTLTNAQGIANVNFTAPDAIGNSLHLKIQMEGADAVWQGDLNIVRAEAAEATAQQQTIAPRKYIIRPLNLGTNTEIRARSTRNLQVQVTDDNDHPMPDVPLLLLLAGGGAGALAGQAGNSGAGILAAQASSRSIGTLMEQTSLRAVTNAQGIANVNFTAPDAIGNSLHLEIQVEGTDVVWQGDLNIVRAEAVMETPQNTAPINEAVLLSMDAEEKACLALINQFRAENQLPPVRVSEKLTNAAKWLSQDNADNKPDDPDHTDSLGRDVSKRLADFGYAADAINENIVVGADSAARAMKVWQGSCYHIRNLLSAEVKVIGVSRVCKKGAKLGCHWSVVLGSTDE